jgi:DNA topoisomerase-3
MDTIELEKTGSRKLKLSAKTIMTIAEKLYTQGYISYPRTETNQFSKETNLRALVELQTPHADWGEFAGRVLEWGPNPRNGNKSDQAHPPIHPTKFVSTLQGDEKRVYELVVRHFLATVSRDAVGSETVVNAMTGGEEFTATGLVVLERNYLDVYVYDRWSGKEIHNYEVGHTFNPTELCLHEGSTNPPSMLTEADLISLMEKHGIGTDATHAEHINTIKERGYIGELDQGHLVPGTLGMGLVEGYELMRLELAQPRLRAGLEEDLKAICQGTKDPAAVLREQIEKYKECYQIITREASELDRALGQRFGQQPQAAAQVELSVVQEVFKCPKCRNHSMVLKQKRDNAGYFISCQGFPACRNAVWFANDVKEISSVNETCSCGAKKVKLKFAQMSMLGMCDEVQGRSRIEGSHFVTCLVCDDRLRRLLNIPVENVKVLGGVVGATTSAVVPGNRPQNRQPPPPQAPPTRNFGTAANSPPANSQTRRGWYNEDDDDDDRPMGGGAVAVNNNRNQFDPPNPPRNTSGPSTKPFNLSKLPTLNCKCDKSASKLLVKQGANAGRPFYNCATRTCNYFQWGDVALPAGQTSQAKRKCGICRQEGHNKKNCPNVSSF